jgi:predicted nucleotidyltransferase
LINSVLTDKITPVNSAPTSEVGETLRRLREGQGLSLRALEGRCGVAAGRLSRIENGHVDPRVSTVLTILDGLDATLDDLPPLASRRRGGGDTAAPDATTASVTDRVLRNRRRILEVAATYGARHPRLFGSAARGTAGPDSDVDLIVDLDVGRTLFDLAALRAELEEILGTSVDVVPSAGLAGEAKDEILAEALAL